MATVTYTYKFSGNLNIEISKDKTSGEVTLVVRNTTNGNVVATFNAIQLLKLGEIYKEFLKLENSNDLVSVTVE